MDFSPWTPEWAIHFVDKTAGKCRLNRSNGPVPLCNCPRKALTRQTGPSGFSLMAARQHRQIKAEVLIRVNNTTTGIAGRIIILPQLL